MGEYNDIWDEVVWPVRAESQARVDTRKHLNSCRADGVSPASRPCLNRWGDEICLRIPVELGRLEEKAASASAESIQADLSTPCVIPSLAHTEFHPPGLIRGLEVTLSPKFFQVPAARSCRI